MTTITKRLLVLLAVLVCGLGLVFLIPKHGGLQPVGIALELPEKVGDWHGEDKEVTEKEKTVLGRDTEFARKVYTNPKTRMPLWVSIVLSGQDVNTSLHRPERCLPAQGYQILDKSPAGIPLDDGTSIPVTRLHNLGRLSRNGQQDVVYYNVYYYWFAGFKDVVASPFQRSIIDWKDRLFNGYNQRWAYVTVAVNFPDDSPQAREAADELVKSFVAELFPKIWKPGLARS